MASVLPEHGLEHLEESRAAETHITHKQSIYCLPRRQLCHLIVAISHLPSLMHVQSPLSKHLGSERGACLAT